MAGKRTSPEAETLVETQSAPAPKRRSSEPEAYTTEITEPVIPTEATATGEGAYAGEGWDWPAPDTRPPAEQPGTPEHLELYAPVYGGPHYGDPQ